MIAKSIETFREKIDQSLAEIDSRQLVKIVTTMKNAHENGRTFFVMGNGGSATTATHMVCDMKYAEGKTTSVKAMNLCDNVGLVTALANDNGYGAVFLRQIERFVQSGDVLVAISVSGDSENIVQAISHAKKNGAVSIGFFGSQGGRAVSLVDYPVVVSSNDFPVVESVHCVLTQMIAATFRNAIET